MTRFFLLVVSFVLAHFSTTFAKEEENKVTLYPFLSDNCVGPPPGGDINVFLDECYNLPEGAMSVKPIIDPERDHWVDLVNQQLNDCSLLLYNAADCQDTSQVGFSALPGHLSSCVNSGSQASLLSSVKFVCVHHPKPADEEYVPISGGTRVVTFTQTSWTIGQYDEKPTPIVKVETQTHFDPGPPTGPPPIDTPEKKGVWMFHPWARSLICYECWPKHVGDSSKFECRSGPKHAVECGKEPDITNNQSTTVTATSSVTITIQDSIRTVSRANFSLHAGRAHGRVGKRNWHRDVIFTNPFLTNTKVCAATEWHDKDESSAEVQIEHTDKNLQECIDNHVQPIDPPDPNTATVRLIKTVWVKTLVLSSTTTVQKSSNSEQPTPIPAHRDL